MGYTRAGRGHLSPGGKTKEKRMTAKQFRSLIAKLEMPQRGVARLFKVNERTARRWALGEISVPDDVADKLQQLAAGTITTQEIEAAH